MINSTTHTTITEQPKQSYKVIQYTVDMETLIKAMSEDLLTFEFTMKKSANTYGYVGYTVSMYVHGNKFTAIRVNNLRISSAYKHEQYGSISISSDRKLQNSAPDNTQWVKSGNVKVFDFLDLFYEKLGQALIAVNLVSPKASLQKKQFKISKTDESNDQITADSRYCFGICSFQDSGKQKITSKFFQPEIKQVDGKNLLIQGKQLQILSADDLINNVKGKGLQLPLAWLSLDYISIIPPSGKKIDQTFSTSMQIKNSIVHVDSTTQQLAPEEDLLHSMVLDESQLLSIGTSMLRKAEQESIDLVEQCSQLTITEVQPVQEKPQEEVLQLELQVSEI